MSSDRSGDSEPRLPTLRDVAARVSLSRPHGRLMLWQRCRQVLPHNMADSLIGCQANYEKIHKS